MTYNEFYKWEIELEDGKKIFQSPDGQTEPFKFNEKNPDFKRIKSFTLFPKNSSNQLPIVRMVLPEESSLIYFRRTVRNLANQFPSFQVVLVGWQMTVNGKNIKYISYVFPDGTTELTYKDQPDLMDEFTASIANNNLSNVVIQSKYFPTIKNI